MPSAILSPALKYIAGGLLILTLALSVALHIERHSLAKAKERIVELNQLRAADRASYEAAQAKSQADNQAQVTKVKAQQEQISEKARSDYSRDLERLRVQARTNQGAAGSAGASGVPQTASGADAEKLCVPSGRLLQAQELELRNNALIDWVNGQAGIDPNK
jgi:hypothetical protein